MDAQVTRRGLLDMQVCVPEDWNDEEVVSFANGHNPCGTTGGWQIRTDPVGLNGDPKRNPCASHEGRVHIALDA